MRTSTSALAATALAVGMLTLSGTAASAEEKAIPEKTIKSECKAAGGTYNSTPIEGGEKSSTCSYKSIDGHHYVDFYVNGKFTGTL